MKFHKEVKKDITFFYTDNVEKQTVIPIADEAQKRGYAIGFTDNILQKAEIGFYCQHVNFAKNSKFSCVHLHDLGQQHGQWPIMWKNEFWNQFDVGFLPNKEWADMWYNASCYDFVRPRYGCYLTGWAKSDFIFKDRSVRTKEICDRYHIDIHKPSFLYAPSWEWDGRQMEMVEAVKDIDVNLIVKQAPWNPILYPMQHSIISDMYERCKGRKNVYLIDPNISIFDVISIADVLISEESSTLYEAMMLDKPVIAVSDWLIPDNPNLPPRLPDFPYDFAIHIKKKEIKDTLLNVISDEKYKAKITKYRKENFPYIGNAAKAVMDVLDNVLYNAKNEVSKIEEKPLIPTPKEFINSVNARKKSMRNILIKKKFVDNSIILTKLLNMYKKIKNK